MDSKMMNAVSDVAGSIGACDSFDHVLAFVQNRILSSALEGCHSTVIRMTTETINEKLWPKLIDWITYSDFKYEIWPIDLYDISTLNLLVKWGF